jgi:hypothetical protein
LLINQSFDFVVTAQMNHCQGNTDEKKCTMETHVQYCWQHLKTEIIKKPYNINRILKYEDIPEKHMDYYNWIRTLMVSCKVKRT